MNKKWLTLLFVSIFLLSVTVVIAQESIIDSILQPLGLTDLPAIYGKYFPIIDFIVYLVIFIGMAEFGLTRKGERKFPSGAITGIAIVLALGLAVWEATAQFNIASFGPIAGLVLVILILFAAWEIIRSLGLGSFDVGMGFFAIAWFLAEAYLAPIMNSFKTALPQIANILKGVAALAFAYTLFYTIGYKQGYLRVWKKAAPSATNEEKAATAAYKAAGEILGLVGAKGNDVQAHKDAIRDKLDEVEELWALVRRDAGKLRRGSDREKKTLAIEMLIRAHLKGSRNMVRDLSTTPTNVAKYSSLRKTLKAMENEFAGIAALARELAAP